MYQEKSCDSKTVDLCCYRVHFATQGVRLPNFLQPVIKRISSSVYVLPIVYHCCQGPINLDAQYTICSTIDEVYQRHHACS